MARIDGPRFGLLQWKQLEEDERQGYSLRDGWYKADLDYRAYWARTLSRDEVDDIKVGRVTVWVRPWLVTMKYADSSEKTPASSRMEAVFATVRAIWKKTGKIGIQHADAIRPTVALKKRVKDYRPTEFQKEINDALRPDLNSQIAQDRASARESIQAVFVPTYDRWGLTFRQGKGGFDGPVTFVATHTAGVGGDAGELREEPPGPEYIDTGISYDAAHELGHALGLEHEEGADKIRCLMHKSLYNSIASQKLSKDEARDIAKRRFNIDYADLVMFTRKSQKGDTTYWTVLHGTEVPAEQVDKVVRNVASRSVWATK